MGHRPGGVGQVIRVLFLGGKAEFVEAGINRRKPRLSWPGIINILSPNKFQRFGLTSLGKTFIFQ